MLDPILLEQEDSNILHILKSHTFKITLHFAYVLSIEPKFRSHTRSGSFSGLFTGGHFTQLPGRTPNAGLQQGFPWAKRWMDGKTGLCLAGHSTYNSQGLTSIQCATQCTAGPEHLQTIVVMLWLLEGAILVTEPDHLKSWTRWCGKIYFQPCPSVQRIVWPQRVQTLASSELKCTLASWGIYNQ